MVDLGEERTRCDVDECLLYLIVSTTVPELFAVWVVQLLFGQLKSPARMMSRWFFPSCERRFSDF